MILPHGGLRFCLTQVGGLSPTCLADLAAPDVGSWSRSQPGKAKVKAMFVYVFLPLQYRCTKNDCGEVYHVQKCPSSSVFSFYND